MAMAAPTAAAASGDSRVLLLPVDLDETAVRTVQFAVANIVRVGDTVVLMHVVPAYTSEFVPDMGVGGEPVMLSVRDVELEKSTVCSSAWSPFGGHRLDTCTSHDSATVLRST